MSEKIAIAYLKAVKSSPLKVMKVTGAIKNMPVSRALDVLKFSKLKLAPIVRGLVYSAMSNAENNHNLDVDNLYIQRIDVGRAFALKRFAARGRGKSSRILKTFSNIRVVLAEKAAEDASVVKVKKASKKTDSKQQVGEKKADLAKKTVKKSDSKETKVKE